MGVDINSAGLIRLGNVIELPKYVLVIIQLCIPVAFFLGVLSGAVGVLWSRKLNQNFEKTGNIVGKIRMNTPHYKTLEQEYELEQSQKDFGQ